jgi:acyl-CoA thioesterase FadM
VRFAHCDPAGIVFFARFFEMMNAVVEDFFPAELGLDYHAFIRDRRIGLGYAHAACDFARPVAMGDELVFAVEVIRIGGASITLRLQAQRTGEAVLAATLVIVTTDLDRHRAISLPDDLRSALTRYKEKVT